MDLIKISNKSRKQILLRWNCMNYERQINLSVNKCFPISKCSTFETRPLLAFFVSFREHNIHTPLIQSCSRVNHGNLLFDTSKDPWHETCWDEEAQKKKYITSEKTKEGSWIETFPGKTFGSSKLRRECEQPYKNHRPKLKIQKLGKLDPHYTYEKYS